MAVYYRRVAVGHRISGRRAAQIANSALMLVCARLRHVAGSDWGIKRYMNMDHLLEMDADLNALQSN